MPESFERFVVTDTLHENENETLQMYIKFVYHDASKSVRDINMKVKVKV